MKHIQYVYLSKRTFQQNIQTDTVDSFKYHYIVKHINTGFRLMKNKDAVGGKIKETKFFLRLLYRLLGVHRNAVHKCSTALRLQVCFLVACNIHVLLLNILFCYRQLVSWLVVRVHSGKSIYY